PNFVDHRVRKSARQPHVGRLLTRRDHCCQSWGCFLALSGIVVVGEHVPAAQRVALGELMVDARGELMVIDFPPCGSCKRAERNVISRAAYGKRGRLAAGEWYLCGRQELQQRGNLWAGSDRGLQNASPRFSRRAIQSEPRTKTAVCPALI